jgi:dihydrodiol dehydrogenase / D-xylose 1-dehydrogenase (NADP)
MDKVIRWGILGPGKIAHSFAKGLKCLPDAYLAAVGSRRKERAENFAAEFGIPKAYGSYEELVRDPDIDVIYVATPHTAHKECAALCLNAGKAVLCEKPLAVNAAQAEEMIRLAAGKKLFLMEAMWTRFLPCSRKVRELIYDGTIGEVNIIKADFGFHCAWNPENRMFNPVLAGGALLDLGVYTVAYASMAMKGLKPEEITGTADIGETGVDESFCASLRYGNGKLASLCGAARTETAREAWILGSKGSIHIPEFWRASHCVLHLEKQEEERFDFPFESTGYQFEAAGVMQCLREGKTESDFMPLAETLQDLHTMDALRRLWGLRYPCEK